MLRPHNGDVLYYFHNGRIHHQQPLIAQETLQGHYGSKKLIVLTTEESDKKDQLTMQGRCGSKKLVA